MSELAGAAPDWARYISRRVLPVTPLRARVAWALLSNPARSNNAVARAAGTSHRTVMDVRHGLEAMGIIPRYRAPGGTGAHPVTMLQASIRLELKRDPARSDRAIAREVGTDHQRVTTVRRQLEAAGQIPPWRHPKTRLTGTASIRA